VLRLTVTDVARSGRAAGFLSAIGTLGSLFGTYLTGYILLPRFPVSTLLFGIAVALVLFAAAVASDALRKRLFLSVACLGAVLVPGAVTHSVPDGTVYPSAYAYVAVKDMPFEGNDVRALVINQGIHAASLHETPETSALEYVKGFRAVDAIVPAPIRMLALGGGGFHVAREFVARHPSSTVDVVEIDPAVMKAAQDAFGPMSDPRISVVMEDARSALPKLTPGYDVLVQDTYAGDLSVPWHLLTRESFAGYGRLLKPDGVFMSNLIMTDENGGSAGIRFQADAVATAKTAFRWVFAISVWKSSGQPMNVLLFAGNGPEPDHAAVLAAIRRETGSLWPREIQLADNGRVWTDDFGPADYESLAMYVEAGR
jgi:predicted membrane-bound spermidine synthase